MFCIDSLVRGGTELQLIGLIDRLDRDKFQPYLLTIRPNENDLVPKDCNHWQWNVPKLLFPNGGKALLHLASYMRHEKVDVVQTFFQDATILGGFAAYLARVPVRFATFRDMGFWSTPKQNFVLKRIYSLMTGFICNAYVVQGHFSQKFHLDPFRFHFIPNGIDTDAFKFEPAC